MDNVEDLFQEVFHMRLLIKVPEINYMHLLSTIPRTGLFRYRLDKFDPDIIRKCDVGLIYARRETTRNKVIESDPRIRRVKVEMGLINEPIPDNKWRIRNLQLEHGVRKEVSRGTTRGVETLTKSTGASTEGFYTRNRYPAY